MHPPYSDTQLNKFHTSNSTNLLIKKQHDVDLDEDQDKELTNRASSPYYENNAHPTEQDFNNVCKANGLDKFNSATTTTTTTNSNMTHQDDETTKPSLSNENSVDYDDEYENHHHHHNYNHHNNNNSNNAYDDSSLVLGDEEAFLFSSLNKSNQEYASLIRRISARIYKAQQLENDEYRGENDIDNEDEDNESPDEQSESDEAELTFKCVYCVKHNCGDDNEHASKGYRAGMST